MLKIARVDPQSPLFGQVRKGHFLVSINGEEVADHLDFAYKSAEDNLSVVFRSSDNNEYEYEFQDMYPGALGLEFDEDRIKICKCDCIFCFIRQQPKGMRRALYIKDEDFRLSFTHGNFITLSNCSDADLQRIVRQRLSPIYISVHATDNKLRRCMLRNEKLRDIMGQIKYLTDNGIQVHAQAVLCPEINDGEQLDKTIADLGALFPRVESLAVVPVGLTKYRKKLASLRQYTTDEARAVINQIETVQRKFLQKHSSRFVWAADEFYLSAGLNLPGYSTYEEMSQFENGVGMARKCIYDFNKRRAYLKGLNRKRRALFLTGHSAHEFLNNQVFSYVRDKLKLKAEIIPVDNQFWGKSVTVSGLLTGKDLLEATLAYGDKFNRIILPPNCLNKDNLFLDDLSLDDFIAAVDKKVVVGDYNLAATFKEVFA